MVLARKNGTACTEAGKVGVSIRWASWAPSPELHPRNASFETTQYSGGAAPST